ncbi:MAG: type II toxin-antitoxin system RelE/ParE family toxin [Ignavibacteriota bacterium]|nr:type II toxin-antitoxin system RelE/ParE family toxin [Ignavibacteriota bacterium]
MAKDKYQVRLLRIAEEDFSEIVSYIGDDNIKAANELANMFEINFELLSNNPLLGRIPRDEDIMNLGYRYLIVQNYLIFYSIGEKSILIHRIIHGARNYKDIL